MLGAIAAALLCCCLILYIGFLARRRRKQAEKDRAPAVEDADIGANMAPLRQGSERGLHNRQNGRGAPADEIHKASFRPGDLVAVEDISSSTDLGDAPAAAAPEVEDDEKTQSMLLDGEYEEGSSSASYKVVGSVPKQNVYDNVDDDEGGTVEFKIHSVVVDQDTLQRATVANVIEISESDSDHNSNFIVPVAEASDEQSDIIAIARVDSMIPVKPSEHRRKNKSKSAKSSHKKSKKKSKK